MENKIKVTLNELLLNRDCH